MYNNLIRVISCAILLLVAAAGVQAAVLGITSTAPGPGATDIANLVGSVADADNVGTGIEPPYTNDVTTYIAHDRGGQGQTFLTGDNPAGYRLTGVWVRHVSYTTSVDQTWYQMQAGAELQIRITNPVASGTDGFVLASEVYEVTGTEENALPSATTNTQTGTGLWFHVTLSKPVMLAAKTLYGFDLTSLSGLPGILFFETDGIRDDAVGGNPYADGAAYVTGSAGAADNVLTPAPGDRVFVVDLEKPVVRTTADGRGADTYLTNDASTGPDVANAWRPFIEIRRHPSAPRIRVGYIRFDLTGLEGDLSGATLTLSTYQNRDARIFNIYALVDDANDDAWDEPTITYNNAPGFLPAALGQWAVDPNKIIPVGFFSIGQPAGSYTSSVDLLNLDPVLAADTNKLVTLVIAWEGDDQVNVWNLASKERGDGTEPRLTFPNAREKPSTVIWVSDNKGYGSVDPNMAAEHGFVDLLRAQGYDVIYKNEFEYIDGTQYWRTLDPNKVAELEAADLIILSRNGDSGSYSTAANNEPNQWNAVTTPILSMSAHMSRVGKWGWLNGTATALAKVPNITVVDANHPIFAGVTIDPNGQVAYVLPEYNMDWVKDVVDAGNGKVLATRGTDGWLSIVTWEAGQKYFEAGTAVAGGPRMLFVAGTGSKNVAPTYAPDGMYNLTPDGEKMFLNAVTFMVDKGK